MTVHLLPCQLFKIFKFHQVLRKGYKNLIKKQSNYLTKFSCFSCLLFDNVLKRDIFLIDFDRHPNKKI